MIQVSYPGVYVQEKSSGVRTITGVATSIAAFIDGFPRGLLDEAVQCLSYADFEREFGGISTDSPASYGVKQFFQNGGGECWVVRVSDSAAAATVTVSDTAGGGGTDLFNVTAGRQMRGLSAQNPGTWGNGVRLDIDYDSFDPSAQFNLTVSEVATSNGRTQVLRSESFRNLTMQAGAPNFALDVVNAGSAIVQLDRNGIATALPTVAPFPRPAATGTLGTTVAAIPASPLLLSVDAGGGARAFSVAYTGSPDLPTLRPLIEAALRSASALATTDAERALIAGATVKLVGSVGTGFRLQFLAGRGATSYLPAATLTMGGTSAAALGLPGATNAQQIALAGGTDGTMPVNAPELTGTLAAKTGIYALEDVDLVNLLCMPRVADLPATNMNAVYSEATTYIASRRGFLLIDIPEQTASLDAMQTWMSQNDSLRSRDAAVYFPRTFVPDPVNGNRLRSIASSGTVAGLYGRTDATRGVWKAPAGTEAKLENVQSLAYLLTDLQNGALNPLGVNCLRTFPVYSHICWGARTLDGADQLASEWKYIPIRRLALYIEESLFRGTKWVVFEPNDEPLWAQIRLNVGVFMRGLFNQGAFQGSTPAEAYFVKCDKETTTQADRNAGIVNIEVGFAPLKPAEFVVLTIQQIAGDLQV
ncbi:phage tail sheath C-terminal domain-containing protein [Roseateles cellulosilyticus]|uniref:Phage tail sheath subtilisin-like domain-containing protein n=1 Tax=Pelomonas cellulosilytica TaxID=2906762 RepID=A0ABS8Y1V8_9BURK|nr:phage tail sheath C-terminal domain-containing protein [Pelomonas sp. P8]MCE4555795.1 phage tail sheath subtilisin-like domain-containing protein [Pelomonas sp. P8]